MKSLTKVPVISFPKSGNTWLRFVLANIYKRNYDDLIDFKNINEYTATSNDDDLIKIHSNLIPGSPVFIKQHSNYSNMEFHDYEKVIYIYRNGFDALYSYWHFVSAQSPGLYRTIEQFVNYYWSYCGHWGEHLCSWIDNPQVDSKHKVLAICYEEMLSDPLTVLKRCTSFLGKEVDEELLAKALISSDKKNMQGMMGSAEFMKSRNAQFHFVRSGKAGEGEKLNEYCQNTFLAHAHNYAMMKKFNYINTPSQWDTIEKHDKPRVLRIIHSKLMFYIYKISRR